MTSTLLQSTPSVCCLAGVEMWYLVSCIGINANITLALKLTGLWSAYNELQMGQYLLQLGKCMKLTLREISGTFQRPSEGIEQSSHASGREYECSAMSKCYVGKLLIR